VEVAIKLDLPRNQVTQLRLEYWILIGQDKLATLYTIIKGRIFSLSKLYRELVIKRGMSLEAEADVVDTALHELPHMESLLDQATRAAAREQEKVDYLENRIRTLEEEEKRRKRTITLSPYNYYVEDSEIPATKAFSPYYASRQPAPLPYWPSGFPDLSSGFENEQDKSKKRKKSERHLKEISLNSNQGIVKSSLSAELVIYSSLKNLSTASAGTDQNTQSVNVFQEI
jgi:hypothetical protein